MGIGDYAHCGAVKRLALGSLQLAAGDSPLELTDLVLPPVDEAEFAAVLREAEADPTLLNAAGAEQEGAYMPFASRFGEHRIGEYIKYLETLAKTGDSKEGVGGV